MNRGMKSTWGSVVNALKGFQVSMPIDNAALHRIRRGHSAHVQVIEWSSHCTVLVTWCDPCLGNYAEQVWQRTTAKRDDICILTGAAIQRGDVVYRPRTARERGSSTDVTMAVHAVERCSRAEPLVDVLRVSDPVH